MTQLANRSNHLTASIALATLVLMTNKAHSNPDPVANPGEPAHPVAHYRPLTGWVGDVHPFHWKGKWWMAHLQVPTGPMRRGLYGLKSALATSEDLIEWTPQEIAIDDPSRSWWLIGMHAEEDQVYAFYNASHGIDMATSTDGLNWHRHPASPVFGYDREQFARLRDPAVFKVAEGDYRMMLTARLNVDRPHWEIGAFAHSRSTDLVTWTEPSVLFSPGNINEPECPEMFRIDDRYYLVGSPGIHRVGPAIYRMSSSPDGPWSRGDSEGLDGEHFPAPNSASDGNRRLVWSWVPTSVDRSDFANTQWGGHLTFPREIYAASDGSLFVRAPRELDSLRAQQVVTFGDRPERMEGNWEQSEGTWSTPADSGFARLWLPGSHSRFEAIATVTLGENCEDAGFFFRAGDNSFTGYEVAISPRTHTLHIRRHLDSQRSLATRHVELPRGRAMELRVFVDGDIVEVFLDGRYSLVARAHHFPPPEASQVGYFTSGGSFDIANLSMYSLREVYMGVEPPPLDLASEPDPQRPGGSVAFPRPHANGYVEQHEGFEISGSMTMSCWYRSPEAMGGLKRNLIAKADGTRGYHYGLNLLPDDSIELYSRTESGFEGASSPPGTAPSTGDWVHVAGVVDKESREIRLYVNGQNLHTRSDVDASPASERPGPFRIGYAAGTTSSDAFIGLMDEVGIWNRPLSHEEIDLLWSNGTPISVMNGCVGYWDFESVGIDGMYPVSFGVVGAMGLYDGATGFAESAVLHGEQ